MTDKKEDKERGVDFSELKVATDISSYLGTSPLQAAMSRVNYKTALLVSCFLLCFTGSAKTSSSVPLVFSRQKDYDVSLDMVSPLSMGTTQGAHNCVVECAGDPRCVSALYEADTGRCLLQDGFLPPAPSSSPPVGWQLWQLQVWPCPTDRGYTFRRDVGLCYRISYDVIKTWGDANATCYSDGGHLLIVDSQKKQDFMKAELTKLEGVAERGEGQWKGYYVDAVWREGSWFWSSNNHALDFRAWFENEELVGHTTDTVACLLFNQPYEWASVVPNYSRPFVCEVGVRKPGHSCH